MNLLEYKSIFVMIDQSRDVVIKLSSFDSRVLDKATHYIINAITKVGAQFSGPLFLPLCIKRISLNRSPHIDRKSMEQFEIRIHRRVIAIRKANSDAINSLSKLELPSGIEVKVEVENLQN